MFENNLRRNTRGNTFLQIDYVCLQPQPFITAMMMFTLFCVFAFLSPSLAAVSTAVDKLLATAKNGVTVDPEKEYECLLYRLEDKVERLKEKVSELQRRAETESTLQPTTQAKGKQYAFSAFLSPNNTGLRSSGDLKFIKVISNVGGAYNEHTGVFTAEVNGVYVFTVNAHTYSYSKACTLTLFQNNATIVSAYSYDRYGLPMFGNTAVVELRKKDVVHVAITASSQCYLSGKYSTFSGHML